MDTKASGIKEICIGGRFKQMNSACSVWERRGSLGLEKHEEHRAGRTTSLFQREQRSPFPWSS
jgi:hypothetical protein